VHPLYFLLPAAVLTAYTTGCGVAYALAVARSAPEQRVMIASMTGEDPLFLSAQSKRKPVARPHPDPVSEGPPAAAVAPPGAAHADSLRTHSDTGSQPGNGEPRFARGTFWRIERDGVVKAYVLGTLHMGTLTALGVPADVFAHLAQAQALVLEVTPDEDVAAEVLRTLPKGVTLRALLGDQAYGVADSLAKSLDIAPGVLNRLQPWAALAILQYSSHLPGPTLEETLVHEAVARGIPTLGLESAAEQFHAMACISLKEHALIMRETLEARERFAQINDTAITLYRLQEIKGLMDYLQASVPLSETAQSVEARENECLIAARSRRMVDRLDRMLGPKLLFVAVGAFHLVGESGLLRLLEARGYQVLPMPPRSAAE
jgi:uncharacterized protein YbaP (TraB family)